MDPTFKYLLQPFNEHLCTRPMSSLSCFNMEPIPTRVIHQQPGELSIVMALRLSQPGIPFFTCTRSLSFPGLVSSLCSAVAVSPSRSAELHLHQCDHFMSFSFSTTPPAGHQKDPTNYRPMPRSLNLTTTGFQSRIGFPEGAHYYGLRVRPFPSHGIERRSVLMQNLFLTALTGT